MKFKDCFVKIKKEVLLLLLILISLTIVRFYEPLVVSQITDKGLIKKNLQVVAFFSSVLLGIGLITGLLRLIQTVIYTKLYNKLSAYMYEIVFEKLLKLPISFFEKRSSTEMVNSISADIDRISLFMKNCFSLLITNIFLIVCK